MPVQSPFHWLYKVHKEVLRPMPVYSRLHLRSPYGHQTSGSSALRKVFHRSLHMRRRTLIMESQTDFP